MTPHVKAASPQSATTCSFVPRLSRATAIPRAADRAVPACPAPYESWTLSSRLKNPLTPPSFLSFLKLSPFLPVNNLWTYPWWDTSKIKRSVGVLKIRCSAIDNSTTPRFGPTWPPLIAVVLITCSRISCASMEICSGVSFFTSFGDCIPLSKDIIYKIKSSLQMKL